MEGSKLNAREYRELLRESLPSAADADTVALESRTLFTPTQHRRALDPNATIVQGGRGVGKTVWFNALQDSGLRSIAASHYRMPILERVDTAPGFGARLRPEYPGQRKLGDLIENSFDPEDIWTAVALQAFGVPEICGKEDWSDKVSWVQDNAEEVERIFIRVDTKAARDGRIRLILFDALDRLHVDRTIADKLTRGALKLALTLRVSTRNLRAKLFIRYDMFESAGQEFPDASKLLNNMVELRWDENSLYSLLFHLLSESGTTHSEKFKELSGWEARKMGSKEELERQFEPFASPYMGTNHRKGHTFTWIPNHLADGRGEVSPRSFLSALGRATEETIDNFADHTKALHWDAIRRGVQHASTIRVAEVAEDTPWVQLALSPLEGERVPIERERVIQLWEARALQDRLIALQSDSASESEQADLAPTPTGPVSNHYEELVGELKMFGIFTIRGDGRLDLPDVYRIAFKVGRKGGVPLQRS